MFVIITLILEFMMSSDTVEMIKQFEKDVVCCSLSFHGDAVYIGCYMRVIQWTVVTDAVVRLEGYPGLICCGIFV